MKRPTISVIAPVYNEAEGIAHFVTSVREVLKQQFQDFEIVIVDDGSTDATLAILKQLALKYTELRVLVFTRNYGVQIAVTAGIEQAHGEWIVLMDSDMQHPPELIPQLYAKGLEGYDVVYARRIARHGVGWFKKVSSKAFFWLARKMTGLNISEDQGTFRIINRRVAESLKRIKENNRHMVMLYAFIGFPTTAVDYEAAPRYAGTPKYTYRKLIGLALDAIIGYSIKPLRIMSGLSVLISALLFVYTFYVLLERIFINNLEQGIASILCMVSGLFAVLFLFLALISEYIGRTLTETKGRPLYYIQEEISHSTLMSS